jgi:nucleotide-binding universal stress UspA family protein
VDPVDWSLRKTEAEAYLEKVAARLAQMRLQPYVHLLEGTAAERITEYARSEKADLILLSSHGQGGISPWEIGGVVSKVLHRSHTSALLVRAYQPCSEDLAAVRYREIVVPLDGSQRAEHALPVASALARYSSGRIRLAHVVPRPEMSARAPARPEDLEIESRVFERNREEAYRYLEQLQQKIAVASEVDIIQEGPVAVRLDELAHKREVDLVVLSAHGYSGQSRWRYGSITTTFLGYSAVPVMVLQDLAPEQIEPTRAELASKQHKGH